MESSQLFVFGYFGYITNQLDGQTVKTRTVHQLFEEKLGGKVPNYDTEELKTNKFGFIQALFRLLKTKHFIYLPAQNNLRYFFPVLFYLSKIFRFKIHYFVVGGWLTAFLKNHRGHSYKLRKIAGIYTETKRMKISLENDFNIHNAQVFPNFRFFEPEIPKKESVDAPLKAVFFSRINKKKGIDFLFELAEKTSIPFYLDFYGPINKEEKVDFVEKIAQTKNARYLGILQPENVNATLAKYDILLLPTQYFTEGLPGAIVDAYISGIPVIVTNWLHASEFVNHERTGFIVSFDTPVKEMLTHLENLASNPSLLFQMKHHAAKESSKYTSEAAWKIIEDNILKCKE